MQDQGDRPARPGRPSLLSTGPQAEPERQRILSSLEGTGAKPAAAKPAAASAPAAPGKSRGLVWGVLGLGALVVGAVAFALSSASHDADPQIAAATPVHAPAAAAGHGDMPGAVAASPASSAASLAASLAASSAAPVAPAPAGTADATPLAALAATTPPEPSTAAVLNDVAEPSANPLADMAPPARHAAGKGGEAKEKAATKREARAEQARLAQQKAKEKAKEKSQARPARREADSDVVLLAALMAHMQPTNRKATPAEQLQVCKQYNAAGEEQCRARVCEAAGRKEPACKGVPVAKVASDT
ncbi:hypothetical protein [Massilia sp. TN1-12]|uniref:hypothetical protein n=1 Tax=Massilia paldalensis TaxID=3377675 RepID=UPI00384EF641